MFAEQEFNVQMAQDPQKEYNLHKPSYVRNSVVHIYMMGRPV